MSLPTPKLRTTVSNMDAIMDELEQMEPEQQVKELKAYFQQLSDKEKLAFMHSSEFIRLSVRMANLVRDMEEMGECVQT